MIEDKINMYIGRTIGFKQIDANRNILKWPFADGTLPEDFVEYIIEHVNVDYTNRDIIFSIAEKANLANKHQVYFPFEM